MSEIKNSNKSNAPVVKVTVNEKWCKKCGICIAFCPKEVFEADEFGLSVVKHPERCIRCMLCVIRCPDFAVDVEAAEEDAERN